ncbi:MAG TPA: zinc ribbon domain-containing protein [Amycolatopsis sp.]|nr:zinc ribbon domain-containing protein [Amycolatopsis sp.]
MVAEPDGTMRLRGEEYATELTRPYWEALRRGEFALQRCHTCGRRQHYPRRLCHFCGSGTLEWVAASRSGTVVAAVWACRSSKEELRARLPYPVALIRMAEGPLVLAESAGGLLPPGSRVEIDSAATLRSGLLMATAWEG